MNYLQSSALQKRSHSDRSSPILSPLQHYPQKNDFIPLDSLNSPEKSPCKQQKTNFLSFLEASSCYCSHNSDDTILFYDDTEALRFQAEELQSIKESLEKSNQDLQDECLSLETSLKQQASTKKDFENALNALNQYIEGLEKALNKTQNELKFQKSQNETLALSLKQPPQSKKPQKEFEAPKPQPIHYKPLTQRSQRSSRDVSFTLDTNKKFD